MHGKGLANRVGLNMGNCWNTGIGDCTCTAGWVVSEQSYCTSKLKILRIKKREYRDGIKSRETRPGWCEAHNACVGTMEGF